MTIVSRIDKNIVQSVDVDKVLDNRGETTIVIKTSLKDVREDEFNDILTSTFGPIENIENDIIKPVYHDIELTLAETSFLISVLSESIRISHLNEVKRFKDTIKLKDAQMACMSGQIGKISLKRVHILGQADDSVSDLVSYFDITYYGDVGDQSEILHELDGVQAVLPPGDDAKFEWLRTLVGGNHKYTNDIAVSLENFRFEDIDREYADKFNLSVSN